MWKHRTDQIQWWNHTVLSITVQILQRDWRKQRAQLHPQTKSYAFAVEKGTSSTSARSLSINLQRTRESPYLTLTCLQSKKCETEVNCSICKKSHPTPPHEDRPASTAHTSSQARQPEENSSILSCLVDEGNGGRTSIIVPVWISSTSHPETETLVYALLDTQSSNIFLDQEVCVKTGAELESVKAYQYNGKRFHCSEWES